MLTQRRCPWRSSKNSRCVREHWCRTWTDSAGWYTDDIPWDRGILGHFLQQHAFNIAWMPGRNKDLFSLDSSQFDNRSKKSFMSIDVKKCWINTIVVPQTTFIRSSEVTNHGFVRMSPKQSNTPSCGSLKPSQIQRKLFVANHFEANGGLFLLQNWSFGDCFT